VRLERDGSALRVYANFPAGGVSSQTFPAADVRAVRAEHALQAVAAEWSLPRDPQTRIAHLRNGGGSPDRRNGDFFLNADSAIDDGTRDILFGDPRRDWFLAVPDDVALDRNP
jgi:hypothetical protein